MAAAGGSRAAAPAYVALTPHPTPSRPVSAAPRAHISSKRCRRRPAPGGGPGVLSVVDSRTGKRYEIPISEHGTIRVTDLKAITAGGDGAGLRTFDNGYVNTTACRSAVSYIDGDAGVLRYRGIPIEQLAEKSSFLEVSYLVLYGHLPGADQLARWEEAVMRHSGAPPPPAAFPLGFFRSYTAACCAAASSSSRGGLRASAHHNS
jgi:citrate synthase